MKNRGVRSRLAIGTAARSGFLLARLSGSLLGLGFGARTLVADIAVLEVCVLGYLGSDVRLSLPLLHGSQGCRDGT